MSNGTGGKGFTIRGQKISIWYDNDGIRIRRGDSARRNFDRMVTWEEAADRIRDMYEEGIMFPTAFPIMLSKRTEGTSIQLALHFRDTNRNPDERLSYQEWQETILDCLLEPEAIQEIYERFEYLQKDMDENPGEYHQWEIQNNPKFLAVSVTCSRICPGRIRNSR